MERPSPLPRITPNDADCVGLPRAPRPKSGVDEGAADGAGVVLAL
ncbi:hypothetical protein [Desulfovibrio sp. 3_1_syn3]|nr:hypothetical protein [Desulfovibrio sp. 3_1_syn3]